MGVKQSQQDGTKELQGSEDESCYILKTFVSLPGTLKLSTDLPSAKQFKCFKQLRKGVTFVFLRKQKKILSKILGMGLTLIM